ncbi:GIY-YIG nuclease family protein [Humibacter sp.]|jgi:hypothetical protein|uniref:GIY-YIG nuclease family protein n=1 Tax=Humibacter sp. TaxID=1940291 RepID=UPI002BF43CAA|nr:GIY-YIG nuclease family protein [Humibacter sp.]HVX07020.1 GIY-YIG nuclease family protein [Humibacter sp.]
MDDKRAAGVCCSPGCGDPVSADAPVPLCERHLAAAADWAGAVFGVEDVLPSPCLACGSRVGVRYPSGWVCASCEWVHGEVPEETVLRARVNVVYYLRLDTRIKIGTTGNLGQRMRRLWHDELVAIEPGDRLLERSRHEQFARYRLGPSEWFERSPEIADHVARLSLGAGDPWALYARWVSESIAALG